MPSEDNKLIFFAFLFALVPALIGPVAIPQAPLTFFAPFLALMCYKRPLNHCLWYALICGLILDLLSARMRLGVHAVNYCVVTWLLNHLKSRFFEDKIFTLPVMTFWFAILSTLLLVLELKGLGQDLILSWQWVATDLLLFPLADALYALVWFALPAYLLRRRPQGRDNTLCLRKK